MKYLLVVFFLLPALQNCLAQQATVNAAGNTYSDKDITFEWSIGEMTLVETMMANRVSITNGVLQPLAPVYFITDGFSVTATNLLSPNGDGKNDVWIINDIERYPDNEVTVFDRSGRVMFNAKNYQNNWTGQLAGKPLSEGTYYYALRLTKGGKTVYKKGFITILN